MDIVPQHSVAHGGDLTAARRRFAGAPEPFIDLSTGINPHSYPVPQLSSEAFTRLPEPAAVNRLAAAAARAYGVLVDHVVCAPGTQILLPLVAGLVKPGRAAVLGPTYAEHLRTAQLAGHEASEVADVDALTGADLAIVTNPNNPDGRVLDKAALLAIADQTELLVVDEAFMDVGPVDASLAGEIGHGNIVVLRSFGKFFGLAGLRLGFALAAPHLAVPLRAQLGPWAVSGAAIAIGKAARKDRQWIAATRDSLARSANRLDGLLTAAGLVIVGGTSLFRLIHSPVAPEIFERLGEAGILVRRFEAQPSWLRFGLPGREEAWERLRAALTGS